MADVARRAGVDVSTVSRALSQRTSGRLREETVARVHAAAKELGYRPNELARGLRMQRSRTVGMLVPDLTNPFFPPVVRGVEAALAEADHTLIVANTDNDAQKEQRALQTLVDRQVDGVLLATTHLDTSVTADEDGLLGTTPVVLVNRRSDTAYASVVPDDAQGVALVMEHLLGLGHRRIGHVAGPADTSTGRERAEAFERQARAADAFRPECVVQAPVYSVDEGVAACEVLLDRCPDITAICAANDLLAIGSLRTLRARGRRVPEDVSVVGFNDMPLVDLLEPPLTTVRVPQYEMGFQAGRILLDRLSSGDGDPPAPEHLALPGELVVRRSTAAPSEA